MISETKKEDTQRKTGRDRQREETRQRVFHAAVEIFRRDGVAESRIEDIAQLAGVSRGSFYFHFPTKDHVLTEILARSQERLCVALEALPTTTPLSEVLDSVCQGIARDWTKDPLLFPEVATVAFKQTAFGREGFDSHPVRPALKAHFRLAAERGELSPTLPPELLADFFLVNVFAAVLTWSGSHEVPLETILQGVIRLFLRGAGGG